MILRLIAVMTFIVKLRVDYMLLVLLLELPFFFALLYLESSKQFSHYYDFSNYIYFSCNLIARHLV